MDKLPSLLKEEFPQATWNVVPSQTVDPQSSLLVCDSSIQIRVQAVDLRTRGWSKVPTVMTEIHQRYSDVPSTKLSAPTFDGFVAMKALAWCDRRSARDLFDLEGLSHQGEVKESARELIDELGGFRLSRRMMMGRLVGLWHEELAHQTKLDKTEDECLQRVLAWWGQ